MARLDPGSSNRSVTNLTPDYFAAADPQIYPDASKILFSARQTAGAAWQVWEMDADGSRQHQITHCSADCLKPAFLPHNRIVYTSVSGTGRGQTSELFVSDESGAGAHPITFGPGDFEVETVLQDGRILASAASPLVAGGNRRGARTLYTLHPDGTELTLFRQGIHANAAEGGAQELRDGTVLIVERRNTVGRDEEGKLAWVRPAALRNSPISPGRSVYWSAHELDGGTLVVSLKRPASANGAGKFDLYAFNLAKKSVGPLIYRDPNFSSVQAVPLEQRPTPRHYWSILHPESNTGRVVCLNAYLSADVPGGQLKPHIARVRVLTLESEGAGERALGEALVEADGSFYVSLPANQPVRFELLDAKGTVIHAQKSWVWARPGEDVGCLGCHEDQALTPENHWPLALKRMDTPFPLGTSISPQADHSVGVK